MRGNMKMRFVNFTGIGHSPRGIQRKQIVKLSPRTNGNSIAARGA
jgi:hypothetical protein